MKRIRRAYIIGTLALIFLVITTALSYRIKESLKESSKEFVFLNDKINVTIYTSSYKKEKATYYNIQSILDYYDNYDEKLFQEITALYPLAKDLKDENIIACYTVDKIASYLKNVGIYAYKIEIKNGYLLGGSKYSRYHIDLKKDNHIFKTLKVIDKGVYMLNLENKSINVLTNTLLEAYLYNIAIKDLDVLEAKEFVGTNNVDIIWNIDNNIINTEGVLKYE